MKYFEINEDTWQEAIDEGWNTVRVKSKNMQFCQKKFWNEETEIFIEEKLPKIFDDFYQKITSGLIKSGMDEGDAIEIMEEMTALELSELLIQLGGYFNPTLVKEVK